MQAQVLPLILCLAGKRSPPQEGRWIPFVFGVRQRGGEEGPGSRSQYNIHPIAALKWINNGKTFQRINETLSWSDALRHCQLHHTDLADLQSVGSVNSLRTLYSLSSSIHAWIGLYFDVNINGPVWSSGSAFSQPQWTTSMPVFKEGICGTLSATMNVIPTLGAASCTEQKPFICYFDTSVGHRLTTKPALSLTTSPKAAEVQINGETFIRFDKKKTWMEALQYCRRHYTDLADLQRVTDDAGKEALRSITTEDQAWIGLYYNAASALPSWSSDLGDSILEWLQVPQMGVGLCAALGIYARYPPRVYAEACFFQRPFICFHDESIGHRALAELPLLFLTHSSEAIKETTPRPSTLPFSALFGSPSSASWRCGAALAGVGCSDPAQALSPAVGSGTSPTDASQEPASEMQAPQRLSMEPAEPSTPTDSTAPSPLALDPTGTGPDPAIQSHDPGQPGPAPPEDLSDLQEGTGPPLASTSSLAAVPVPPGPQFTQSTPGTTREAASSPLLDSAHRASATPAGTPSGAGGSTPLEVEEQTSEASSPGSPAAHQGTTASPEWATRSRATSPQPSGSRPEPETGANSRPWQVPAAHPSLWETKAQLPCPGHRQRRLRTRVSWVVLSLLFLVAFQSTLQGILSSQSQFTFHSPWRKSKNDLAYLIGLLQAPREMIMRSFFFFFFFLFEILNYHIASESGTLPFSGQHFGVLKADFNVPALIDPDEMKDRFLSEIQEALKLTLGHQQFRLKCIGIEVNKKEN
ncbi:putative C-type lectin domain family 20 member A [Talpa occidentalis]|uniref:putative C-type lectin domain family 20 member A n=1 Tax=Talpa occidentalis TaxID=50954 RepID=UPI0023F8DB67|nr:putative C-type lectin domain family 20 member A [Talpa occidentalis]